MAVEIDPRARETYKLTWGSFPESDVVDMARNRLSEIGDHSILAGGFPCQPFSKSGRQLGMAEERGQVFNEIIKILQEYTPAVVFLENVRNLTGPRQRETWDYIIGELRQVGYRVSSEPLIVSPHRLPQHLGGAPQSRDRVYILGTFVGRERALEESDIEPLDIYGLAKGWNPRKWQLEDFLQDESPELEKYRFTDDETMWLDTWQDFLSRTAEIHLPGHPLWSDYWKPNAKVDTAAPEWKQNFETKNIEFYKSNKAAINAWRKANPQLKRFPASRRKFEWQAQDSARDVYTCLIHLRPSGIRVKKMTYAPALVAMAQTPLIGPRGRKMTPIETAKLQNFPTEILRLDHQADGVSYKQLGNAINVGVAKRVLIEHVRRDAEDIVAAGGAALVNSVISHE